MSYVLSPIAVELKQVSEIFGSKNKKLLIALVKEFGKEFEQIDDMAAEDVDEDEVGEEGEAALTVKVALTQMVMGEDYNEEFGFVYGYALEFVCRHFGALLPNANWSGMKSEWADKVDHALKIAGVGEKVLRVFQLMYRGSPVPIPEIADFPGIGYLRLKEITIALKDFTKAKLAGVKDEDVKKSLTELRGWLETCVTSNRDLVCFYA